jgi:Bacterial Ig-like domain
MARANGMSVSDIIEGNGVAATNLAWSTQAVSMAQQIMSDPSLRPDSLVVQSWQTNPSPTMDPTQAGTLASVAQDVETGRSSASAVPAVAQYDASGLLKSVTWSGGWTATANGTNLVFSSPTGAVVSSTPWSAIRAFAFDPTTGVVTETVASTAATTTQPENDTTSTFNVVGGQFVFAPVVSSGAGTLTMALASISETGFPGSGVTNRTKPTLTGNAPAGATVQLQVDGAAAGSVAATAAGAWTFTINSALSAGAHLIDATSTTSGGATQEREYVVSANLNQRSAPTLALAQGYDTGYAADNITDVTKPVLAGATDPQVQLTVSIDGKQVGLTTSDASGNWQYLISSSLALGDHTVSVQAAGPPGTSPTATSMQLTIDTAAQEAAMTSTDPLFDPEWYIKQHPDAGSTAAAAYQSYMTTGWKKGYDPSPFFSTDYYLSHYADVATSGMNPLQHFEQYGWREGRNPSGSFDTIAYYNAHPSLATSGIDPVVAYVNSISVTS